MEKSKRSFGNGRGATLTIIIALIVLVSVSLLALANFERILLWWSDALDTSPRATIDLSDSIVSMLSARAQLVVAEQNIRDLPVRVNVREGILNANGYGATYEADFSIKAGYDFKRPSFVVRTLGENSYEIMMPPMELISCSMTPVNVVDRSTSLVANWNAAQELGEYMLFRQAVREALDNIDLEQTAQANAREALRDLLQEIWPDIQLQISFTQSNEHFVDDTCQRREPLMWTYDAEENQWRRK